MSHDPDHKRGEETSLGTMQNTSEWPMNPVLSTLAVSNFIHDIFVLR